MPTIQYISDSFKGTTHYNNQDGLIVVKENDYEMFIVFDGVSLSENQIEGVRIAVEYIKKNYSRFYSREVFRLDELMIETNNAIINSEWTDALTTYCAAVIHNNRRIIVSHLGDSRIYSYTKNALIKRTDDDVIYPGSNVLTKCLGIERLKTGDFYQREIDFERKLLICTDGFYELMERDSKEFADILNLSDLNRMKSAIYQEVAGNNRDDATYILITLE